MVANLTGRYTASIKGSDLYGLDSRNRANVRIDRAGNKFTGIFGNSGTFEGYIESNRVLFNWESSRARGKGKWEVSADETILADSWKRLNYNAKGTWSMLKQ